VNRRKILLIAVIGVAILVGLMYGSFLMGRDSVYEAVSISTSGCQPADSIWCQTWIPGCYPITAKRCHPGFNDYMPGCEPLGPWCLKPTPFAVEPAWPLNQKSAPQLDPLEVKKTELGFYSFWLICILLLAVWWINKKSHKS